jgi:hypothetical protein
MITLLEQKDAEIAELRAELERLRRGDQAWEAVKKYGMTARPCGNSKSKWEAWSWETNWIAGSNPIDAVLALRDQIEDEQPKEGGA